ncbi:MULTISPECIES: magnesium-translocating P-type ATPase [Gordonia]|uniref:Magnesium-transporting ATPase, P-type 1 n=1 Tax=Gordonia sihwensis NBRC 108236 TaxID=1223544 RepID=L7LQG3_9ACTN|nr:MULTISPECIES: magnesium-translocating P-type ATPase [Gordonia]AUH68607.1 magnesium-translocating P-type ATPase [Gordonia sp. YC-JH1]GAC62417.1 putative magnesium-transporting ATPase [Gordonia sihwensis NBRC 108236]
MQNFSTPLDVLGRRAEHSHGSRPSGADVRRQATTSTIDSTRVQALLDAATGTADAVLSAQSTSLDGLVDEAVGARRLRYGANELDHDRPAPVVVQFARAFVNPFIAILVFLAVVMVFTDVVFADPAGGRDYTGVVTVGAMVLVSAILRFWQEYRSGRAAENLKAMVRTTAAVTRNRRGVAVTEELPVEHLVPGDIVRLAAGDMIPADVRLIAVNDLQINQAMLTGEALPAEKTAEQVVEVTAADLLDAPNLAFMGTSVVSGSGTAVVLGTGRNSYFGSMSKAIVGERPETAFDVGIKKVSYTLIQFMLVMVPVVFVINGLTKDWTTAFLFGVTTAVGLTPEMLPLIVTANLAKGANFMARRKVIVKRLGSIQNVGAMDVLATDKTGTLTEDRIVLERHIDVTANDSDDPLWYAAVNAHFQTGLRNLLDDAVLDSAGSRIVRRIEREYTLVDEIPFDFERRRLSVVVDDGLSHLIVTKGAVEELLDRCVAERRDGTELPLTVQRRTELDDLVAEQNALGMRVLAVAVRSVVAERGDHPEGGLTENEYTKDDEASMTLVGFLLFLDPPKDSAAAAITSLRLRGVAVKVITGDNPMVAATVCRKVGVDARRVVSGAEIDDLSLKELAELAERTSVFAKVNPTQKARIVEAMRTRGHTVGFLGDGINDAPALRTADVGISVDTAVDIAKESADIILLEKDLTVLESGVIEGRRTFVNTMKYIKMTASSNFGNMFSVLVASALLPFIPMIPIVVLVQNLAYDLAMLTLPWDRADSEDLARPRKWESRGLGRFMVRIGPLSSIFDITTYALMWFVFAANSPVHAALFQSGWFVESIISQTLIVHLLRTGRVPFVQSRAGLPVVLATAAVCVFGLVLPFTGFGQGLGLVPLPWSYFPWLIVTLVGYCVVTQVAKRMFVRRYGAWI